MIQLQEQIELQEILQQGTDNRIYLDAQGNTKYGAPLLGKNLVNRGSCTCSPADEVNQIVMNELLANNSTYQQWIDVRDQIEEDFKTVVNGESGSDLFELYLAPSGTDLLYYLILFGKILNTQNKPMLVITSCLQELGTGTTLATEGKYHGNINQFGALLNKEEKFLDWNVKTIYLDARTEDGTIIDQSNRIKQIVAQHADYYVVVNQVFGSKSGVEDNVDLHKEVDHQDILWNIDLCQFRHSMDVVRSFLSQGMTVMVTGSKFYQSTPFIGGMLIPSNIQAKLVNIDQWHYVSRFKQIFARLDFPLSIRSKVNLDDSLNRAMLLKWTCATQEMKRFAEIPDHLKEEIVENWWGVLTKFAGKSESIELMPRQESADRTIFSFRLKHKGNYLNNDMLKQVHKSLVTKKYDKGLFGFDRLFIGQPVNYSGDKAYIRLAIGAKEVRKFYDDNETKFNLDLDILSLIEKEVASCFE